MCGDDVERTPDTVEETIGDAAGASEPNPAADASHLTSGNTNDGGAVNDDTPCADAGGIGNHPPTHTADAAEQPEEGDGAGGNDGANDNDDDHDVLLPDELDEAAAQHKEDWRRPTVASPEPVNGEETFNDTVAIFNRFMSLPEGAAEVLCLWTFGSYALHACNLPFAPRLMITAPGANSGKTTLLNLLTYLVRHPEPVSDITPASLYRSCNARKCVLLDEADHNLPSRAGTRNELIQMINSGHKRATAVVIRVESAKTPNGTIRINRRYSIYALLAMAGNGIFAPNTTRSRCYEIHLRRKMPHEEVESFIPDEHSAMMRETRMKIHRFVLDNKDAIRDRRPVMDSDLRHNRQRDNSGVLLQIADVIGGDCPARARAAIKAMTRGDVQDIYEVLLEDIAAILLDPEVMVNYAGAGQPPNMRHIGYNNCVFSADLCDAIVRYFPHRETYTGLTTARLATMLSRFSIEPEPRVKRRGSDNGTRWYRRDAFDEWFNRYGFEPPEPITMEPGKEPDPPGEPEYTPAKGDTPIPAVPDQELPGSSVAASTALTLNAAGSEPVETNGSAVDRVIVEPRGGEKKRAYAMRRALDACISSGTIASEDVLFESPWFSVIKRGGQRSWATRSPTSDELDTLSMDGSPIVDTPTETIMVGDINVAANLSTIEFERLRAIVNKYIKNCVS